MKVTSKAVLLAACVPAIAVVTLPARAQEAPAAVADPEQTVPVRPDEGDVVVTGSRIARPEIDFPNPITSFTAATIEQSGRVSVIDFLKQTPALLASTTQRGGSDFATNLLDLRNLGTDRTLVLVDGRRHVAGLPGTAAVDINTIPQDLIERVDIQTGGASAIYGADAVSGVVNFVLKRDFEGLSVRGQAGISNYGDTGNRFLAVTAGKNFADDRGNVALAYNYTKDDPVSGFARYRGPGDLAPRYFVQNPDDFLPDAEGRPFDDPNVFDNVLIGDLRYLDSSTDGAVDLDFDFLPDFTGSGKPYNRGRILSGGFVSGGDGTPIDGYNGYRSAANRVHNVNLLTTFSVSDSLRLFAQGKYVDIASQTRAGPYYDFFTYLTPENPYLIDRFGDAAAGGAFLSRDNFDLGDQNVTSQRRTYRAVAGADGRIGDHARYELSYVYGRTTSRVVAANQILTDRYYAAQDVVRDASGAITCRINLPGETIVDPNNYAGFQVIDGVAVTGAPLTFRPGECVPLNLLGSDVVTRAALEFVSRPQVSTYAVDQHVVSGSLTGDFGRFFELPGGPVGFAIGGEYRRETSDARSDSFGERGLYLFNLTSPRARGRFHVLEGFGELRAPLLKNLPFAETLEFGAALRLSDYSTVGGTTTWAVNGVYAPVRDIRVRGTWSQAVRAPNIGELFAPFRPTFAFVDDPCDVTRLNRGTQFRAANCQAVLTAAGLTPAQIAGFRPTNSAEATVALPGRTGGNPDLNEETARTWTAGIVITPAAIPGLNITADWFDIKLRDAIRTDDVNAVVNLCVDQPTVDNVYCSNVTRDSTTGFVRDYFVGPQNVAEYTTAGLDLSVNYLFRASPAIGTFNFRLNATYLDRLTIIETPGADVTDNRGGLNAPKYAGTLDLTWIRGPVRLNYGLQYFSRRRRYSLREIASNPDIVDPRFRNYRERIEHDVQLGIDAGERFNFYIGANNLTNKRGDVGSTGYPYSYIGRTYYAGAKIRLSRLF